MNIKKKAISGMKWTSISTILLSILQVIQLTILARFISPLDFGLMAIIMIVVGFSQSFMDVGISNAIIHRQLISHSQLSSLYWLNIFSGMFFCLLFILAAPFIVDFYEQPELLTPLLMTSLIFIAVSVGNQYRTIFQKNLEFEFISKVEVFSGVISFLSAMILATCGYGIYSLVIAMLTNATISSLIFLLLGLSKYHTPSLTYKHSELNGFFSFGLYQMGERAINYFSANLDKLLIGKVFGMQAVGFYNMAWQLIIFPLSKINPVIGKVAFPIYAKFQNDELRLNSYYSMTVKILSLVTIPILAFLCLFSIDIVNFVFGAGWEATAELLAILACVGVLKAIGNPGGAILLARGYASIGFWWNLFWCMLTIFTLPIALYFKTELETVPLALLLISLSFGMIWHYLVARFAKIKYRDIAVHFIRITIVCFGIALTGLSVVSFIQVNQVFLRLLIGGLICIFMYFIYIFMFEKNTIQTIINRE